MTESHLNNFIELKNHWHSITVRDHYPQGIGKWKLYSRDPHRVYQILREILVDGGLEEVTSIKVRCEVVDGIDKVFVYTAPYTDLEKIIRLAEKLTALNQEHDFQLDRSLYFKTDLHTTWSKVYSQPGDGYHELLREKNWIYQYRDGELVINAAIQALHSAMENREENQDPEFQILRSLLPSNVFARE